MVKMVEAELKTQVREEVSNFSVYLTQLSMVKMVELKMEVREEVCNFLFTWPRCQW